MKKIEHLYDIENRLVTKKLQVYQPNPQFVERLKIRLADRTGIEVEKPRRTSGVFLYSVGVIGFLAGILWLVNYIISFFKCSDSTE